MPATLLVPRRRAEDDEDERIARPGDLVVSGPPDPFVLLYEADGTPLYWHQTLIGFRPADET